MIKVYVTLIDKSIKKKLNIRKDRHLNRFSPLLNIIINSYNEPRILGKRSIVTRQKIIHWLIGNKHRIVIKNKLINGYLDIKYKNLSKINE